MKCRISIPLHALRLIYTEVFMRKSNNIAILTIGIVLILSAVIYDLYILYFIMNYGSDKDNLFSLLISTGLILLLICFGMVHIIYAKNKTLFQRKIKIFNKTILTNRKKARNNETLLNETIGSLFFLIYILALFLILSWIFKFASNWIMYPFLILYYLFINKYIGKRFNENFCLY